MTSLDEVRDAYVLERPTYEALAAFLAERLKEALQTNGVVASVSPRAKEIPSFVVKARGYDNPLKEITDKAGIRVVVDHLEDIKAVRRIVRRHIGVKVLEYQNKVKQQKADQLGYLGYHFLVTPKQLSDEELAFRDLIAEIQLQTKAQNAWASVSHPLTYKPRGKTPRRVRRRVNRLVALVEIFDDEVSSARVMIQRQDGYEANRMLEVLQRHMLMLTAREFDADASLDILGVLGSAYRPEELESFAERMADFVRDHHEQLEELYERYSDTAAPPLLYQPESLAIFERLEAKPMKLKRVWNSRLEPELLQTLSNSYGRPVG